MVMTHEKRDAYRQLSRNDRWGTCPKCPRDVDGYAFPEFCEFKDRQDHQRTVEALIERYRSDGASERSKISTGIWVILTAFALLYGSLAVAFLFGRLPEELQTAFYALSFIALFLLVVPYGSC